MSPRISFALLCSLALQAAEPVGPLVYDGPSEVTPSADGGLQPVVGVQNIQVFRANRTSSAHADGLTDTYNHAPMLAYWHGRFYLEYLSGAVNEHDNPTVTSLTTSADGLGWSAPRVIFPAITLPDGTHTISHQRMGFYVAPDGRLLALSFYGTPPSPNDGKGLGRAVREIHADGTFGPIYFIRVNTTRDFPDFPLPYPLYSASSDPGFVSACEALLANQLITAQWWEEDQLDESGFYRVKGKALSFVTRPDGSTLGIWKNRLVATTSDRGSTWSEKTFATNLPNNASKYWLQSTADGRYALVFNPTNRNRYPLAVTTSDDCAVFSCLASIHSELPDQRFGGYLKNMGPQYVRGIVEGNGTPSDFASAFWLTYSVNKEDIWVARVPVPVATLVTGPIHDDFETNAPGALPAGWNSYSPLWAPVRIVSSEGSRAVELSDEDPYDYARIVRVFPATHGVKISFKVFARQKNGRLEIELLDAHGARPVRLALREDGHLWICHEAQWFDTGPYASGRWQTFELEIPSSPDADRCAVLIDGQSPLPRPAFFTDPVKSVERISFRTGEYRERGYGGHDLPHADEKSALNSFLIDDVVITPVP